MKRSIAIPIFSLILTVLSFSTALAESYDIPVTVGGKVITITVEINNNVISSATATDTNVVVGKPVAKTQKQAAPVVGGPVANRNANLREGPGTSYAVKGSVTKGQSLTIKARTNDGNWYQLDTGLWLASFLVDKAPAKADIPVAEGTSVAVQSQPATPPTETVQNPEPQPAVDPNPSTVSIGQELKGKGWRFKVSEVHKRKAVYFYDNSYVAQGYFLVVVFDVWNEQSGTDYFDRLIDPYLTDVPGNRYLPSSKGTGYSTWQFGGLGTVYSDINPGNLGRVVMAFDVPEGTGKVLISTALPGWIDLGDFASMKVEDKK